MITHASEAVEQSRLPAAGRLPFAVVLFLTGMVIPLIINIGSLRLSAYRIVLLLVFLPTVYYWLSGKVKRVWIPDLCVILICVWSSISLITLYGFSEIIETAGILIVETLGAYFLGRYFIRSPEIFHALVRLFFRVGMLFLPLAIYEAVTGENLVLKFFEAIGSAYPDVYKDRRLGLDRVQGPFEHPILFGVFFGSLVGLVFYVLGYGLSAWSRTRKTILIALTGALALSSGPLSALVAQLVFILWDKILHSVRSRWYILSALSALAYVVVDLLSNRTPFQVFISYLAFNSYTAYNRLLIWEWGTKSIFSHPWFGIGFGDWERLWWMTDSVDMFWILPAMQHGIPVWILYFTLFFSIFFPIAFRKGLGERVEWYRMGYLTTLFGFFMAGWTVHYWNATFVLFMFLLGAGVWMLDYQEEETGPASGPPSQPKPGPVGYTRFPVRPGGPSVETPKHAPRKTARAPSRQQR